MSKVRPHDLPYPSLSEINLLAFEEVSEEFHNELYAHIEFSGWRNEYLTGKPTMPYKRLLKDGTIKTEHICLTEFIRHQIHHPENTNNVRYTQLQLIESINMMRNFLSTKK